MEIGQVANFKTNTNIPIEKIPIALNTKLKKNRCMKEKQRRFMQPIRKAL